MQQTIADLLVLGELSARLRTERQQHLDELRLIGVGRADAVCRDQLADGRTQRPVIQRVAGIMVMNLMMVLVAHMPLSP